MNDHSPVIDIQQRIVFILNDYTYQKVSTKIIAFIFVIRV